MASGLISRRWWLNYALVAGIIVALLIGNLYQSDDANQPGYALSQVKPQVIDSIEISGTQGVIRLERNGTQWHTVKPILWPANNIIVERIISILRARSEARLTLGDLDLVALGLMPPQTTLTLNQTRIDFGTTNNIGQRRYLRLDDKVYLVPDLYLAYLEQGLAGLVEPHLLPRALSLQSLQIGALEIRKNAAGAWQAEHQAGKDVGALIDNWQTLPAKRIKPYQVSTLPLQVIAAQLDDGSQIEFYLIATQPDLVLARPDLGLQYHFSEGQGSGLLKVQNADTSTL